MKTIKDLPIYNIEDKLFFYFLSKGKKESNDKYFEEYIFIEKDEVLTLSKWLVAKNLTSVTVIGEIDDIVIGNIVCPLLHGNNIINLTMSFNSKYLVPNKPFYARRYHEKYKFSESIKRADTLAASLTMNNSLATFSITGNVDDYGFCVI